MMKRLDLSTVIALALLVLTGCNKAPEMAATGNVQTADANSEATTRAAEETGNVLDPYDNSTTASGHKAATGESKDYYVQLPLKEFMAHVMQYGGDGIWKHQGFINDEKGERSLFPKTDEEWEEAESGARTLAELTNLLLLPGRRIDEPKWTQAVHHVRSVALQAADAAERKNQADFFAAGSQLDEACDDCHKVYDPTFQQKTS